MFTGYEYFTFLSLSIAKLQNHHTSASDNSRPQSPRSGHSRYVITSVRHSRVPQTAVNPVLITEPLSAIVSRASASIVAGPGQMACSARQPGVKVHTISALTACPGQCYKYICDIFRPIGCSGSGNTNITLAVGHQELDYTPYVSVTARP